MSQHEAVIDAAKHAGAALLAYTSILHADTSTLELAKEHLATENYLRASGIPFVMLRNGWYAENLTAAIGSALQQGSFFGAAKQGRFAEFKTLHRELRQHILFVPEVLVENGSGKSR